MADTFRWSGLAHALRDGALIHILNTEASDARRTFTLTQWDVKPWVGVPSSIGSAGAWRLRGITAHNGGETLSTVSADPSSAALPAQVTVRIQSNVTLDSTASLRDRAALPVSTANISWPSFGNLLPAAPSTTTFFETLDAVGAVQRLILPSGRGLAIVQASDMTPVGPETWYVTLTLRDEGSGATYFVHGEAIGAGAGNGHAIVSVMNDVGSGTTISVANIELIYAGELNPTVAPPSVRLMRTIGSNQGGEVVPLTAADPGVAQPAALVVRRGRAANHDEPTAPGVGLSKDDLGYPIASVAAWQRLGNLGRRMMGQGTTNALSQTNFNMWRRWSEPQAGRRYAGDVTGLVVEPQTGVALVTEQSTMNSTYWVEVELIHTPPPAAVTGNTYSRARVVNT